MKDKLNKLIKEVKALGVEVTTQNERGASFKHTSKERFKIREIAKKHGFLCSYYGEGDFHTSSVIFKIK
jgi:hypothetical protein